MSASLLPAPVAASTDPRDVPAPSSPLHPPRAARRRLALPSLRPTLVAHVTWWMVAATLLLLHLLDARGAEGFGVDLDVYLRGGSAIRHGEDLYAVTVHGLLFTYPPFAATAYAVVAGLPAGLLTGLSLGVSLVALAVVVAVVGHRLALPATTVASIGAGLAVSEPVFRTLLLGQVNAVLLLLVVLDLLVLPRGRQGLLVGLAAGVKLVPGVFVLWFLLRRDRRGALLSGAGFVATLVVGALADPAGSRWYWGGGALSLGKFGRSSVFAVDNQSLSALVDRLRHDPGLPASVTVVSAVLLVAVAALVARAALAAGDEVGALLALALGGLLASPVSWTHHWVWFGPVALWLAARRRRWAGVTLGALGVLVLVGPMWLLPSGPWSPLGHDLAQGVVGGCYAVAGLALLVALGLVSRRAVPRARGAAPSQGVEDAASPVSHIRAPRSGRTGILLRARRGRRDGGVAAVEAAIVLPILFVVLFGIIEFGFVFRDDISITTAIRSGTRYAAIGKTGDPTFPAGAVTQVANGLTGVDMSGFQSMWVYDASTSTTPPSACGTSTCLSYPWDNTTRTFGTPTGSWNPCAAATTTGGRVALYIAVKHTAFTGLVPASPTISDKAVFAFEPGACS
ncbi:glycosyltransferase 87 family protein [Lapillicoccus jejuensis]|uniref:TadE-like protein n=1 Tax=Lapillicoccus jejuensis TaxID=402171 RepID=A0A542E2I2_9MICO|nr:glycosyltransferase 87 family protein [Lapillicoccus jejuensis]TQJ09538.1 TadE-like protein [Lapillicoccus jejuensis]